MVVELSSVQVEDVKNPNSGPSTASTTNSTFNYGRDILDIPSGELSATNNAVNLQDAIAILKMIVGLDVNGSGRALSPYQTIAADYDGKDGVGLPDAIAVLKHVVGLTAPDPSWVFFNEANASPTAVAATVGVDVASHVGLVGVLRGDVDGSFAGAVGATPLNETYFDTHSLNHAQFGIYP